VSPSSPWLEEPEGDVSGPVDSELRRADAEPPEEAPRLDAGAEVVVRMIDGNGAPVGRFATVDEARACAESLVVSLADGDASKWPFVAGRYLRPGAIVSVDVVEDDIPRWAGSSERASTWAARDQASRFPSAS
jgi:hypothetical protein